MSGAPLLTMRGITVDFPGVRALDHVDLELAPGEILGLVGENGAGKSTLMKVLSASHPAGSYEGGITLDGAPARFRSIGDSRRAGIAIIHQELALVPHLSIAENLCLGDEPRRWGRIDWDEAHRRAAATLALVGLDLPVETPVGRLGVGEQQLVEIAKALGRRARILILDEPTAALADHETERLLDKLRELRAQGLGCIYISHRLGEVLSLADRIAVLRDGRAVDTRPVDGFDAAGLIAAMVGREVDRIFPLRERRPGEVALAVDGWQARHEGLDRTVGPASFALRAGEIVGLAGLVGAGRSELVLSLLGAWGRRVAGTVAVDGRPVRIRSPKDAIRARIGLVPEDRKGAGLVMNGDVTANVSLANLPRMRRHGHVDREAEIRAAEDAVAELDIRPGDVERGIATLSGGNQQKVVLAKWLLTDPRVLVLDEPTRGVDVGAKVEIYRLIADLAAQGRAVLLISSEQPELLGLCDRILVMHRGRIAGELDGAAATQEAIMALATGHGAGMVTA